MTIKAVLFDLGNTLNRFDADFDEKIFQRVLISMGISRSLKNIKKAFKNAIKDAEDLKLLSSYGKMDSNEYWYQFNSLVVKYLEIAENEDLAKFIHSKWFDFMDCTLYSEAKDVLSELKRRGLKIGIISTAYEEEIDFVLKKLGLEKSTFDIIVGVDTAQCMKPDPAIFKYAFRKLNVRPEEAMFVGDDVEADYKGAKNVGMYALLIDRTEKQRQADLRTIKNLKEILSQITESSSQVIITEAEDRVPDMEFVVGCDLEEFKRYYRSLDALHNYYRTLALTDVRFGELGPTEEGHIRRDPSHLIVWRENNKIIGNAIWHEAHVDDFRDPGDKEVREVLERLLGEKKEFIELHEVWLKEEHRGKGYGKKFFEFFEKFIKNRGFVSILYYTDHPAAITICRNRGWREGFLANEKWYVFCLSFSN